MPATTTSPSATELLTLDLTRTFDAPRELVYRAWTTDLIVQWSTPHGYTITESVADVRPGGAWRLAMRTPGGEIYRVSGLYREVVPNERLVLTHMWEEEEGEPRTETLVIVTFSEAREGGTKMEFHQERFRSIESRDGHYGGWSESFEKLGDLLGDLHFPAEREIVSTRLIKHPRELVFRAYTEPEHLARWWGPKGFSNTFQQFDLSPGGAWRFTMHGPDGTEYPNESVFTKVVPLERIEFNHGEPHVFKVRLGFAEEGEETRVTFRMRFDTEPACTQTKKYAVGCNEENFDRLEAELDHMAQQPKSGTAI